MPIRVRYAHQPRSLGTYLHHGSDALKMATAKVVLDKIVELPLNKVHADFEWNSRYGNPAEQGDSGGELAENEFASLVESIRSRGQDTAIIVRPKGQGHAVVAGFRRYAALQKIAEDAKDKNLTIKCIIRELNEVEAKSLNIRENAARKQLGPADLMVSLGELKDLYEKNKASVTVSALADEVGVGRPYASKLLNIRDKVDPKFVKLWREGKAEIAVNKMEALAKLDKGEQQNREWADNIATAGGRGAGGGRKDKKAWLESAERQAIKIGIFLGELEHLEKISTENLDFKKDLELLVDMKEGEQKATATQRQKIVEAISNAYNDAMNPPEPEAEPVKPTKAAANSGKAVSAN